MGELSYIPAKTIVTRTKSAAWFGTEYNMNIYRGCCHGCIYCDSRSDCYRNPDFSTVHPKADALRIIRDDLRRKIKPGVVGTGAMSDPYNPLEERLELTRHALELLAAFGFGVAIDTKGTLITRDTDVLQEIKAQSPVLCKITVTCAEDAMAEKIEPHAPPSSGRFAAIRALSDAGIFAGVLLMPVLPFLTDTTENIGALVRRAADSGARFIYPAFGMTMRDGQREYFYSQLDRLFPGMRERYAKRYGTRYTCTSPHAKRLYEDFAQACERHGLLYDMKAIAAAYQGGYGGGQLSFF